MKIIGITQRIDKISSRSEVRESLDNRIPILLNNFNIICIPISSFICKSSLEILFRICDGFILSGGNTIGEYQSRDNLENFILDYSAARNIPVLGICRGMQSMLSYEKCPLVKVDNHVNTRHKIFFEETSESFLVNSYHQYGTLRSYIKDPIKCLAYTEDNCCEFIIHQNYPWKGIMWHPERENKISNFDAKLISKLFFK